IDEDSQGDLWLGTWNKGVLKYDRSKDKFISYRHNPGNINSIGSDIVWDVYIDKSDIVWLGTWGSGVNQYIWANNLFKGYTYMINSENTLGNNKINTMEVGKNNNIWIGTLGGGINVFNPETEKIKKFINPETEKHFPSDVIRKIFKDSNGRIWIGSDEGLSIYLEEENKFKTYKNIPGDKNSLSDNRVYAIEEGKKNVLWIGMWGGGLNRFDIDNEKFDRYTTENSNLSTNNVWEITRDKDGIIWLGTTYGLNKFNSKTKEITRYLYNSEENTTIRSNSISDIYEDKNNNLWIGTWGGGLHLLDKNTMEFINFSKKDGLLSNNISTILEDEEKLWISTTKGIMSFDYDQKKVDSFNVADGLQGTDFTMRSGIKSEDKLYFGGLNGFNVLSPENIKKNTYKPPVVLTLLTQNGHPINLDKNLNNLKKLELNWDKNNLEFEFAALNYIQNEENQYAYKLEGFDEKWNHIGNKRYGKYTNIPDGNFILKIKASNNDDLWNNSGVKINITVAPPFWREGWFKIIITIILFLMIYLVYKLKLASIKKHNQRLEKMVQKRSKDLIRKNKELEFTKNKLEEKRCKLENALKKVKKLSITDSLTGLPNRRFMMEKFKKEVARYQRNKEIFSIVMTDIDKFKNFNDTYGHEAGDYVLKKVSDVLKETLREIDHISRWGGEEFLMILPETDLKKAFISGERLRNNIKKMRCNYKGQELKVTITLGITEFDPLINMEKNIDKADQALYLGKKEGRNCCVLFKDNCIEME
ncbi:MAG: ligand-binding sensor domain-containing protein, partial [Fusobacteriota bacterium]